MWEPHRAPPPSYTGTLLGAELSGSSFEGSQDPADLFCPQSVDLPGSIPILSSYAVSSKASVCTQLQEAQPGS